MWRRVKAFKGWIDDATGRPTSAAFKDNTPDPRLSVHRSSLTTLEWVVQTYPDYGVWSVLAGVPRAYEQMVYGDPTADDPSHTLVAPKPGSLKKKRMEAARRMADAAQMVREIPAPA